jgi:hypothetical protein
VHFSVPVDRNCVPAPLPPPGLGVADGRSRRTARPSSRVLSGTRECRAPRFLILACVKSGQAPGNYAGEPRRQDACKGRPAGARRGSTPWTQRIGTASATVRSGEDGAPTPSLALCATCDSRISAVRDAYRTSLLRVPGAARRRRPHIVQAAAWGLLARREARAELAAVTRLVGAMARRRSRSCPGLGSR